MELKFKRKMKKATLEIELVNEFGVDDLAQSPYTEEGKRMTLYYYKGIHVGTWMNGEGWMFDYTKESADEADRKFQERFAKLKSA